MRGTVKSFDQGKGYGFIEGEDGREYLVHFTGIRGETQTVREKTVVEFLPVDTPKGPQAVEVSAVERE